ncbi:MAG: DUF4340 domain-containing protein [Tepidisphaeraceae bacterium]|jgi:hypothetical protein
MKFKTTGILVLALLAALGFYLWSGGAKPPATPTDQTISPVGDGQLLIPLDVASVNQINITDSNGLQTTVRKDGDHWLMTAPVAAPAFYDAAEGLAAALTTLRSSGRPDSDPGSASGLDKPQYTVEVGTYDGKSSTLYVGQKTGAGDLLYARVDGGDINLIDGQTAATLKLTEDALRDKHLLRFQRDDIQQFEITRGADRLLLERIGGQWQILEPVKLPADLGQVRGTLDGITQILATEFLKPDSDELPYARFDHPTATVWVTTRPPSTQPTTEPSELPSDLTLTVGAPDSLAKDHYFARTGDGTLAKIAGSDLDHLIDLQPWQLRDLTLVSVAPEDVREIIITRSSYLVAPAGSTENVPTGPISESVTDLRRTPPQALGPATQPAAGAAQWHFVSEPKSVVDPDKVQELLADFQPLKAESYFATPPQVSTERKYTLVLKTASGEVHLEVRIPPGDNEQGVGTYNGLPFRVSRQFQDALTVDFHQTVDQ